MSNVFVVDTNKQPLDTIHVELSPLGRFLMLESSIVESFNKPTATGTHKGVHNEGFSGEAASLSFPSWFKRGVPRKGR